MNRRHPTKRRLVFSLCILSLVTGIIYYNSISPIHMIHMMENLIQTLTTEELFIYTNLQDDMWVLKTPACNIQRQDPWESSTKHYFRKLSNFTCPKNPVDVLVIQNDAFLIVNKTARGLLTGAASENKSDKTNFTCKMWKISRNLMEDNDRTYRLSNEFDEFKDRILMNNEYSKVECYFNSEVIYHNYFFRIIRKAEIEIKCGQNEQFHRDNVFQCRDTKQLSVLVIGVGSVSKSNFLRQFPLTFDFLANNILALDFHGYNRVGPSTFPCLVPYLSGMSAEELKQSCWDGRSNTFDNCRFLWDTFEAAGYRTAFVENLDGYGQFLHRRKQLTHYYGHTLYMPMIKYLPNFQNGCWRGKPDDEMVLNWAYEFQKEFKSTPHFGHFWLNRFSHDNINTAQHADTALASTVSSMYNQGLLNNTLLILMSDHGLRYGSYRETEMGRVEENLPFLFMLFPQRFHDHFPRAMDNLRHNRFRLITTYDLHHTLKSIISCDYQEHTFSPANEWQAKRRGVSLFQHLVANRSCEDAGIPSVYCACKQNVTDVDVFSPFISKLSGKLVQQLNELTAPYRSVCAFANLDRVLFAKKVTNLKHHHSSSSNNTTYIIAIVTSPGNAKFEAIVEHVYNNNTVVVNHDIRRINYHGTTSYCIKTEGFIKSLCLCI